MAPAPALGVPLSRTLGTRNGPRRGSPVAAALPSHARAPRRTAMYPKPPHQSPGPPGALAARGVPPPPHRPPCHVPPPPPAACSSAVSVLIEKPSMFTRTLFASVDVSAPASALWSCLTDYDSLGEYIPSLAVNRCLDRYEDGCKLEQVGEQDVALGAKFKARVVLEIREHPSGEPRGPPRRHPTPPPHPPPPTSPASPPGAAAGIPEDICCKDGGAKGSLFPYPRSTVPAADSHPRDISFDMVEGDFVRFQGVWRIQDGPTPNSSRLSYAVVVTPQRFLPVGLVEGRISGEIQRNLTAVREIAEGTFHIQDPSSAALQ